MTLPFWLASRPIRDALRRGDPDAARKLLEPFVQDGQRHALKWKPEIARGYRVRGEKALRADNPDAAWKDLLNAETVAPDAPALQELRAILTRLSLAECRAALLAGKPYNLFEILGRAKQRSAHHPDFPALEEAARDWVLAQELADKGDFAAAFTTLERAKGKAPPDLTFGFDRAEKQWRERQAKFRESVVHLYRAAEARDWPAVIRCAEEVIHTAPQHRDARNLINSAWEAIPGSGRMSGIGDAPTNPHAGILPVGKLLPPAPETDSAEVPSFEAPRRFLLWIDGVGGYLICLASRVGFGQATGTAPVDVPLFADVSRLHAEITRDGESYILESGRELLVNGEPTKRALLKPGDRVTLGGTCQFLVHQPVSISPTVRLELVSGHRLPMAVDGVILMAENLILGPGTNVHIPMPQLAATLILYRSKDGLGIRCPGAFKLDNRPHRDRAPLPIPSFATGDGFSFSLEAVGVG